MPRLGVRVQGKRSDWDSTITDAGLKRIRAAYESGVPIADIARRFDRSPAWIRRVLLPAPVASSSSQQMRV